MPLSRPAIPRDTRLLLTIVLVAVGTLWVLARLRFPDAPPTPNPVPPVLAQLAPSSVLDDMPTAVAQLQAKLDPWILTVQVDAGDTWRGTQSWAALRFRNDLALAIAAGPPGGRVTVRGSGPGTDTRPLSSVVPGSAVGTEIRPLSSRALPSMGTETRTQSQTTGGEQQVHEIARDPASALTVLSVDGALPAALNVWNPRRLAGPRVVVAVAAFDGALSFEPVFVGSVVERESATWSGPVWMLPPATALPPGALVFNIDGAWAGVAADDGGRRVIVPADRVIAIADRLLRETPPQPGWFGIDVDRLTASLSAATGAASGVIVTWIDPRGPATGLLAPGDVVEEVDGNAVHAVADWSARTARASVETPLVLHVRRGAAVRDVRVTPLAGPPAAEDHPLGLHLQTVRKLGAAVVGVDPGSAADRAGLAAGDVLTFVGDVDAPTSAQALKAFTASGNDRPVAVGVTRGATHFVRALERKW